MKCPKCSIDNGTNVPVKSCRCGYSSFASEMRQARRQTVEKVGSELKKLIPSVFENAGCGCCAYAMKMDVWGIEGCLERREEIIERLVSQAAKTPVGLLPTSLTRLAANKLFDKAIARVRRANEQG